MRYTLKWLLFSLAFVPLLVNLDTLFPFIFTKTLLIRSAVAFFWILFAVYFFTRRREASELVEDNWRFVKNPLYIFVSLYILLLLVSTIFAVDSYKSFFGDIERGEGFLGIFNFFAFFVAALFVFKKEDWATFFRFNLITGAFLIADSVQELAQGEFVRAQSTVGNPTFLAGYFLFVTFSALISFALSKKRMGWRIFSFIMIFGGVVGVFLTGTRGAILGLAAGIILSILYFVFRGRNVRFKVGGLSLDAQKVSIALLLLGVLSIGGFVFTKQNAFWQNIPGINRFTSLTLNDSTLQTRLISAGVSLASVNPANAGVGRLLIGYGWDNFNIAYNKYYNPEYMRYESLWFDRAHDKIFDVLVMNGALGLLAYLGAWFLVFYLAFKKIKDRNLAVPIIFFGAAYFVQDLFVFDQISTYIPVFAFLSFTVFASSEDGEVSLGSFLTRAKEFLHKILPYKLPIVAAFFGFTLVAYAIVPYNQSLEFIKVLKKGDVNFAMQNLKSYTEPYNYAQPTIRNKLITLALPLVGNAGAKEFVDTTIALQEEFVSKEPYDPRDINLLGGIYRLMGDNGDAGAYKKSEEYFLEALALSPRRQDHLYDLATLYADQGDFQKMNEYADTLLAQAPTVPRTMILYSTLIIREGSSRYKESMDVLNRAVADPMVYFSGDSEVNVIRTAYNLFMGYFSGQRDYNNYLEAVTGARDFELRVEEISKSAFAAKAITAVPPAQSPMLEARLQEFLKDGFGSLVN